MAWLVLHLAACAVLTGVAWVVQVVVYPAFALVGSDRWAEYHAAHTRAITQVIALPWLAQGVSILALLLSSPADAAGAVVLGVLALATVVLTFAAAVPAHRRLGAAPGGGGPALRTLMRAHLVRSLLWSASVVVSAAMII